MKKKRLFGCWMIPLFVVTAAAGCEKPRPEKEERVIRPVRYVKLTAPGGSIARTFSGTAKAVVESRLSFKVEGTVEEIAVQVGDSLTKGGTIARLDPADYRLKVQEAQAARAKALAEARSAEDQYKRVRALYENRNASRNDLDVSRAAYESTKAAVKAADKQLELARRRLAYTRLLAPSACAVAAVHVEVNENVAAGQPIVSLTCGSKLEVRVPVPEGVISNIGRGDTARVRFNAAPESVFEAKVTEVGVAPTGAKTTFPVTVRLSAADPRLRSGMAAEVTFQLSAGEGADYFRVPPIAVGEDDSGRFVFTVTPAENGYGTVLKTPVTVGRIAEERLEIRSGLERGDIVVTAGISRIESGDKVRLLETSP